MSRRSNKRNKDKSQRASLPDSHVTSSKGPKIRPSRATLIQPPGSSTIKGEEIDVSLAAEYPRLKLEIDGIVADIAKQVSQLPPHRLLHQAWFEFAKILLQSGPPDYGGFDGLIARRMIDYIQSVIAGVKPKLNLSPTVSPEDWQSLKSLTTSLFTKLSLEFPLCRAAHLASSGSEIAQEREEFQFVAESLWLNVRGRRQHIHERIALEELLSPHSDVLVRLFGVNGPTIAEELEKIMLRLTFGFSDAAARLHQLRDMAMKNLPNLRQNSPQGRKNAERAGHQESRTDSEQERDLADAIGQLFGFDLFDVQKITNLPLSLLDELAWSPGEEEQFFSAGDMSGWPLRVWPTMKRPFIRINGRIYCFDYSILFDNFYRALRRIVLRFEPEYEEAWKLGQEVASENLPLKYLEKLLPGALIYKSVHYKIGKKDCECDGVAIYDQHLFIVEVKAGAFTYTSPTTDLEAHLTSLEALAGAPAKQGQRLLNQLKEAGEVQLQSSSGQDFTLRRSDFRHFAICAVTVDSFTEQAARGRHLEKLGVEIGPGPVWVLAIDDLRVYADIFANPLIFLHYAEQRVNSAQSDAVDLTDELDHLGLYLERNNYRMLVERLHRENGPGPGKLFFDGLRDPIDEYYRRRFMGESVEAPRQNLPPRINELIQSLANSPLQGRSEISSLFLDGSEEFRVGIAGVIDQQLEANSKTGKVRPYSTYGQVAFTLVIWSAPITRQPQLPIEWTQVISAAAELPGSRLLLELEYSVEGNLHGVYWSHVSLSGLSGLEVTQLQSKAENLRQRRLGRALSKGELGAYDLCLCGSGKKYKWCCKSR